MHSCGNFNKLDSYEQQEANYEEKIKSLNSNVDLLEKTEESKVALGWRTNEVSIVSQTEMEKSNNSSLCLNPVNVSTTKRSSIIEDTRRRKANEPLKSAAAKLEVSNMLVIHWNPYQVLNLTYENNIPSARQSFTPSAEEQDKFDLPSLSTAVSKEVRVRKLAEARAEALQRALMVEKKVSYNIKRTNRQLQAKLDELGPIPRLEEEEVRDRTKGPEEEVQRRDNKEESLSKRRSHFRIVPHQPRCG